ncbi:MAG: alcohol dehydrogenase catalytic domain-containing protein [Rhodobacteraceae bacterium]|nr:alcohol dehydrogenase catalytic domain-containing protein [Paracoccaceae bacterium]
MRTLHQLTQQALLAAFIALPTFAWAQIGAAYEGEVLTITGLSPSTHAELLADPDGRAPAVAVPALEALTQPKLAGFAPSQAILPANTLRVYLHFSEPMARGQLRDAVRLYRADGSQVSSPFLTLGPELWDTSQTRATLLLDPGRIKQGVGPNTNDGAPLEKGGSYQLIVAGRMKGAEGIVLGTDATVAFRVRPPERRAIDPEDWQMLTPPAGSHAPVTLAFARIMDTGAVRRLITLLDPTGAPVAGVVETDGGGWSFTSHTAWTKGRYSLVIDPELEDVSGNTPGVPFDAKAWKIGTVQSPLSLPVNIVRHPSSARQMGRRACNSPQLSATLTSKEGARVQSRATRQRTIRSREFAMSAETMSAAFYRGDRTFSVERIAVPTPGEGEVTIRVAYCGICGTDMHVYHGNMDARVGFERIIGHEMSGVLHALGDGVSEFQPGQHVVVRPLDPGEDNPATRAGYPHISHNLKFLGLDTQGAMQEYWTVPAHTIHVLPTELRLDHAALIEPVAVACHDVRLSELQPGEDVVVIGSGPIGILVAMVAQAAGGNVLISEVNERRLGVARALGFDTVNPSETDLAAHVSERTGGKGAEVVFEVSGSQPGVDAMTTVAAARARIVMVAIHAQKPQVDMFQFFWRELKLIGARVYEPEDYEKAIELVANDKVGAETIITDVSPLSEIQAAFEALDSNPTAMKSLIKVGEIT